MELTNREVFFNTQKEAIEKNIKLSNSEIYMLLQKANNFTSFTQLTLNFDKNIANLDYFLNLKEKIFQGTPIQYALNEAPFLDLNLYVDKNVLIPRVETEELVTKVLSYIIKNNYKHDVILDLCTGSGCIALYLKKNFQNSKVYASDISINAINVARKNAKDNNLDICFLEGDKLEPILNSDIKLDMLISNPPYVENFNDIEDKVKNYEPINAIYTKDGTSFYEDVFKHHKEIFNEKLFMAFEINYDQEVKLTKLIEKYFDEGVNFWFEKDIYGLTRFLFISRGY